jgi:chemotaxis protein CheD
MTAAETMVRMGELAVSGEPGHVLVSLGLGSCIGLALLDRDNHKAGLAHVVLPKSQGRGADNPMKYADHAVPELYRRVLGVGARRSSLEAVLVGGASMLATTSASLEVGQRNEAAVREQLASLRIPVLASATGGTRGRTVRVDVATTAVSVREAGGRDAELVRPSRAIEVAA